MNGVLTAGAVLADFLAALAVAWLLVRWLTPGLPGVLELLLAWAVAFGVVIVGTGLAIGEAGFLGLRGFLCLHVALLVVLALGRRRRLAADAALLRTCLGRLAGAGESSRMETAIRLSLVALWAFVSVLGALGEPFVYDALTYHLPRIGQWLADGRITHYTTADPRQNFMFVAPEVFSAWLVLATPSGFHGAALAQAYASSLLLGATFGLARLAQLSRLASYGAAALIFGMANVVPQFTSVYTDLFAAGVLSGAVFLWLAAAGRGQGSPVAGLGAGLALGSKATVLYLGPAIGVWLVYGALRYRLGGRAWSATLVPALASALAFTLPTLAGNLREYGGLLGPDYIVRQHHGDVAPGSLWTKLSLNLESSFAQVFEPNSEPPLLAGVSRKVGEAIARRLPEQDPYMEENGNRRQQLLYLFGRLAPDTDGTSFGVLSLVGLLGGAVAAVLLRRPGSGLVLAGFLGLGAFWIFFHALHQWAPYGFRIYAAAAPWMAVATAWWLEGLPALFRRLGWAVWLASSACVASLVLTLSSEAGWRPVEHPEHSIGFLWRQWAEGLEGVGTLEVALPYNRPVAAFYRLASRRKVVPELVPDPRNQTAAGCLRDRDGWLVVPAALFEGREGDVVGTTWLYNGSEGSPFSLAAYRLRRPGESSPPITYRRERSVDAHATRFDLAVQVGPGEPCRQLTVVAGSSPCRFVLQFPVARSGSLDAGAEALVTLDPPIEGVVRASAVFRGLRDTDPAPTDPSLTFDIVATRAGLKQ